MPMNKQAVIGIIKKIFTYHGYNIHYSDFCDMLAEKDLEHLFIKFEPAANFNSIRHFSNNVEKYGGRGILISESLDEKTRSFALGEGLTPWDSNELESWVGRAVLSGALEEPAEKASIKKVEKEHEKTIMIPLRSVPVNIGKSDALSIAEAKVGRSRSQKLKFIPVWYYSYSFSTQKKFKSRMIDLTGDGEGYIHALTGENYFNRYTNFQDNTFVPTHNYEIKQPAVTKEDALSRAVEAITREHKKEIRLNEMIGDTIVFEHKLFAPDPEEINLKMEILHIPVWEIRGRSETIEINGYDGHVVVIKVYNYTEFV